MSTLADAEREAASRLGPFYELTATGGATDTVFVASLRSTADVGGFEGLYLLRREAVVATDRSRTVDRFDAPTGGLVVDFPYADTPVAGEPFELHHLHPDLQLRMDVRAALRRCYVLDTLPVVPPPGLDADGEPFVVAPVGRAIVREVPGADGSLANGWIVAANGNGNGRTSLPPPGVAVLGAPGVAPRTAAGAPAAIVDLTAQAFWLTATRQVLAVAVSGTALPPCGRYGDPSADGWTCYTTRGHVYLGVPGGVPLDALTVRAYRDASGLVDDLDDPQGPTGDDDELAVPLDYVCAFAHAEAWRRHRDRLEASSAEGRFPTQQEASAEATRVASIYADFLFRQANERGDRVASPFGTTKQSQLGLGGTGMLAGAVVNQNDPYGGG